MTTWQKVIVFNLTIPLGVSAQLQCIIKKPHKSVPPSPLKTVIYKQDIIFVLLISWQKVYHYLQILNHTIIVLKWTLKLRICAWNVYWYLILTRVKSVKVLYVWKELIYFRSLFCLTFCCSTYQCQQWLKPYFRTVQVSLYQYWFRSPLLVDCEFIMMKQFYMHLNNKYQN